MIAHTASTSTSVHAEDDAALVLAARAGDRRAFAALLVRHRPLALVLARRLVGPTLAEDVVQEAALQAYLGLDRLRAPARFGAWLCGIALNIGRLWLRDGRAGGWDIVELSGGTLVSEPIAPEPGPAARAEAAELAEQVRAAVASLPPGQRGAVVLFYLAGLSHAEVAASLGVPRSAVKMRLHKARARLRAHLASLQEEPMTQTQIQTAAQFTPVRVYDVLRQPATDDRPVPRFVIRLEEVGGERRFDIFVGRYEGEALASALGRVSLPRPLTYTFTANLLRAAGARLREARIIRLEAQTFYAQAVLDRPAGVQTIDARPSDAINLAIEMGAPITVSEEVFEALHAGQPLTIAEGAIGLEALLEELRSNLAQQRPVSP
jgi:RNA polymerase sigma-70 factor (ECF subfamily)